jgi:hypothetical protein
LYFKSGASSVWNKNFVGYRTSFKILGPSEMAV